MHAWQKNSTKQHPEMQARYFHAIINIIQASRMCNISKTGKNNLKT